MNEEKRMNTENQNNQPQRPRLTYSQAIAEMVAEFEKVGIKATPMDSSEIKSNDNTIEVTFFKKPKKG